MIIAIVLLIGGLWANLWYYEHRYAKTPDKLKEIKLIGWKKK